MVASSNKGFTIVEVLIIFALISFIAALVLPKIVQKVTGKCIDVVNTALQIRTAERQWYEKQGRYAYAVRCFQDPSWSSFSDVCGDINKFSGQYLNLNVSEWKECTLDPVASLPDNKGCIERYGVKFEIVPVEDNFFHGAVVILGLNEREAFKVAGILSGLGEDAFSGYDYSSANFPKTEEGGKWKGFWVEKEDKSFRVFVLF